MPIFINKNVKLLNTNGSIKIEYDKKLKLGMIKIGCGDATILDKHKSRSIWSIKGGTVIFRGNYFIGYGCIR